MRRPRILLTIDELAARGDGVGRDADGRVTFVPGSAPGDQLEVEVFEARKDFARAHIVRILEPGPGRIEVPCRYFAAQQCGGCNWQHVDIGVQRQAKEQLVARALRKLVERGLTIETLHAPVPDYGWRRRARLHWFRAPAAVRAEIGFHAPRSNYVADIVECLQLSEPLAAGYRRVRDVLATSLHGRGQIHLVATGSSTHVVIDGACNPRAAEELAAASEIAGVRLGERSFGELGVELDGALTAADDFAQASEAGNLALVECVRQRVAPWIEGARVLELFAGSGNLSRALAGADITAVDRSVRERGSEGVQWIDGDAEVVVAELAERGQQFDAVVLDPPRQGARDVAAGIGNLRPARVLYISCDPATLARDADILVGGGYSPVWAQPIDLMPQTSHVEVVVEFASS